MITICILDQRQLILGKVFFWYFYSFYLTLGDGMSKTKLIQNRVTNYRDEFVNKLEQKRIKVLLTRLSQIDFFHNQGLFEEKSNCYERFKRLLSLFENGSSDEVNLFVTVLKDLGYYDILELIEPTYVHLKAGKFKIGRAHV